MTVPALKGFGKFCLSARAPGWAAWPVSSTAVSDPENCCRARWKASMPTRRPISRPGMSSIGDWMPAQKVARLAWSAASR